MNADAFSIQAWPDKEEVSLVKKREMLGSSPAEQQLPAQHSCDTIKRSADKTLLIVVLGFVME